MQEGIVRKIVLLNSVSNINDGNKKKLFVNRRRYNLGPEMGHFVERQLNAYDWVFQKVDEVQKKKVIKVIYSAVFYMQNSSNKNVVDVQVENQIYDTIYAAQFRTI